jgi:hypothetical protein
LYPSLSSNDTTIMRMSNHRTPSPTYRTCAQRDYHSDNHESQRILSTQQNPRSSDRDARKDGKT